ncbi:hypothetical protein J6590_076808 [Homalodisca vitripennis]|nr:hypothetical protein J6590_076808 [Homalodisca vitripennis]
MPKNKIKRKRKKAELINVDARWMFRGDKYVFLPGTSPISTFLTMFCGGFPTVGGHKLFPPDKSCSKDRFRPRNRCARGARRGGGGGGGGGGTHYQCVLDK